jgi:hypothetical protein
VGNWFVRLNDCVDYRQRRYWLAELCDGGSDHTPLWEGEGGTQKRALIDLAENMADEIVARGEYVPDDYEDLMFRKRREADAALHDTPDQ